MGHLINPIGFRLGWSASWVDSWFLEFSYYPEFLHEILRLRLYIEYLGTSRRFEQAAIVFSHCVFDLRSNLLFVKIFFYDAIIFVEFEKSINSWKNFLRRGIPSSDYKRRQKEQEKLGIPKRLFYHRRTGTYRDYIPLQRRKRKSFFNLVLFNSLFYFFDIERFKSWENSKNRPSIFDPLEVDKKSWILFRQRRLTYLILNSNKTKDVEMREIIDRLFFLAALRPTLKPVIQVTCLFLLIFKSFVRVSQSLVAVARRKSYLTNYFRLYYFIFFIFHVFLL